MGSRVELHDRDIGCYAEDRLGPMQEDEPVARPGAPEAVVACNISLIRCCIGNLQAPRLTTCLERCVVETATREEPRAESGRDLHRSTVPPFHLCLARLCESSPSPPGGSAPPGATAGPKKAGVSRRPRPSRPFAGSSARRAARAAAGVFSPRTVFCIYFFLHLFSPGERTRRMSKRWRCWDWSSLHLVLSSLPQYLQ